MRLGALLREAVRSARAQPVPTGLVAVLVAAMCLTTMMTVGRAASAQLQVQQRLEEAGSRRLQVTDVTQQEFLTPSVVGIVGTMSTVERVVGLSVPVDVHNLAVGAGGAGVPSWALTGTLSDAVELVDGRWPRAGEALVSARASSALGLDAPTGAVTSGGDAGALAVVGSFRARAPYGDLDAGVVSVPAPGTPAHTLDLVVTSADRAGATQDAVLALLARSDPHDLTFTSPRTLAEVQAAVLGDLARYNRALMIVVMGMGALLVAVVALSDVLLHRRDLGRRRALGAPRWAITWLVVLRTMLGGLVGAVVACAGCVVLASVGGSAPPASFVAGTAVLAVLVAGLATVAPAVVASRQDPVRVLRTP